MDSILNAKKLREHSDQMLAQSRAARQKYVDGMREGVGDDQLRHLHYDAMDASAAATKAYNATLGERKMSFG